MTSRGVPQGVGRNRAIARKGRKRRQKPIAERMREEMEAMRRFEMRRAMQDIAAKRTRGTGGNG